MSEEYKIILFYKFTPIANPAKLRDQHRQICQAFNLKGRMLIAYEGINATFEAKASEIDGYIKRLRRHKIFKDVVFKESAGIGQAFTKLIVRVRPEVVTLGVGELDIQKDTAKAVTADELEKMYADKEDFVVLDLRNDFEVQAGRFEKTYNPKLKNFRDLPGKLPELEHLKQKKVVAVCTGGIRCEKATVLLKQQGFTDIWQLQDGIHTYMQKYPGKNFKGSLFVFDNCMVTPIVGAGNREITGACAFCQVPCEEFYNDDSTRPSTKTICCGDCFTKHGAKLRKCVTV